VYVLAEGRRMRRAHEAVRRRLDELEGVDLAAWLVDEAGAPLERMAGVVPAASEAVVRRQGTELRFRPGSEVEDPRGTGWEIEGDGRALAAEVRDGVLKSDEYPDALRRLWSALNAPHAGDILISAAEGWELVDWGGATHCPGGSHGSLHAGDSLGPLLLCGLDGATRRQPRQWALSDVADLVRDHFGVRRDPVAAATGTAEVSS
jgi:hypothetical protein